LPAVDAIDLCLLSAQVFIAGRPGLLGGGHVRPGRIASQRVAGRRESDPQNAPPKKKRKPE
jgi:hypothetical protein